MYATFVHVLLYPCENEYAIAIVTEFYENDSQSLSNHNLRSISEHSHGTGGLFPFYYEKGC